MGTFYREYDINNLGLREQDEEGHQPLESAYITSYGFTINKSGSLITNPGATEVIGSGITGEPIYSKMFAAADSPVRDWHRLIWTDDGTDVRLYRWYRNGATPTLVTTHAGAAGYPIFADQLEGLLVYSSDGIAPQKYNGSTVAALGGVASITYGAEDDTLISDYSDYGAGDNFRDIVSHKSRLYAVDSAKPYCYHYTPQYLPEGLGDSGKIPPTRGGCNMVDPKDGAGDITKLASFKGQLLVFKQHAIHTLMGSHSKNVSGDEPWVQEPLNLDVGTSSPYSVVQQENDILFLDSERRLRSLQATLTNAELQSQLVSWDIQSTYFDKIREKSLPYVYAEDHIEKNQIWISFRDNYVDTEKVSGDTNIKALYHLNDTDDTSGNGLTLTATNSPTLFKGFNRLHRDAYHLDGTNQYLRRSATAGTNSSTGYTNLSLRIWGLVDVLPTSGNKMYLYSEESASGSFALYLYNDTGTQKVIAEITDSSNVAQQAVWTNTLTLDQWYEFVMTWDGSTITLYSDATSVATKSWSGTIRTDQTDGYSIGALADGSASYFNGKVDECIVWDDEQTLSEISTFYSNVARKNNRVLKFDYRRKAWVVDKAISAPTIIYANRELFTTTYNGDVYHEGYGNTRPDTVSSRRPALQGYPWDNLKDIKGAKYNRKMIIESRLFLTDVSQDGNIELALFWDDQTAYRRTIPITATNASGWGDDWGVMVWNSSSTDVDEYVIYDWVGSGKMFRWEIFKWDDDLQFRIVRFTTRGRVLGRF